MIRFARVAGIIPFTGHLRNVTKRFSGNGSNQDHQAYTKGFREHEVANTYGVYEEIDKFRVHYLRRGTGKNNILLIPGPMGAAVTDYTEFLQRLDTAKFTAIAYDPPGCGRSIPPPRDWNNPEVLISDAKLGVQLMHQLGRLPFTCMGWSEGAQTALIAATELDTDDCIEKLVLWCIDDCFSSLSGETPVTASNPNQKLDNSSISIGRPFGLLRSERDTFSWPDVRRLPLQAIYGPDYLQRSWENYVDNKITRRFKRADPILFVKKLAQIPILHLEVNKRFQENNKLMLELLKCTFYKQTAWPTDFKSNAGNNSLPLHKLHAEFFQECIQSFIVD